MTLQNTKRQLWNLWQQCNSQPEQTPALLQAALSPEVRWHGPHPFGRLEGAETLIDRFWRPLLTAMPDLQRRTYFFIGGEFEGETWVCGTGDLIGTFVDSWLGMPAGGRSVHFRFGEFCKYRDGRIIEIRFLADLVDLARQVGLLLLPPDSGRSLWIPGPQAGGGIVLDDRDPAVSAISLQLVEAMIFGGLNQYDRHDQESQGLDRYWHPHMVWHGPAGIGSAYGLDEFKRNAQRPFLAGFPDRKGVGHQARIAEGEFIASTGWPSFAGTHTGDFLGCTPTGVSVGINIMDFWRRQGERLLENWVLVDLLDACLQLGLDYLASVNERVSEHE